MSIADNLLSQLNILLSDSEKGTLIVNNKQKIIVVNRAAAKLLHTRPGSLLEKKLSRLIATPGWNTGEKWHALLSKKEYKCNGSIITARGEKKFRLIIRAHFFPGKHLIYLKPLLTEQTKTALNHKPATRIKKIITSFPLEKKKNNHNLGHHFAEHVKGIDNSETDYISVISHELKTPLAVIITSAGLVRLNSGKWTDEKVAYHQDKIIKSVKFINRMLDDAIFMDRCVHGKLCFNPAPENIKEFCENIIEEFRMQVSPSYNLKQRYTGTKTNYMVDAILLQHILNNLVSNAIKYSEADGKVELKVVGGDNFLNFSIKDRGIGIKKADIKKLYEPFFRGENAKTIKGNGLGLSIVKQCVEIHGGKINITSKINAGTTVNFTIKAKGIS